MATAANSLVVAYTGATTGGASVYYGASDVDTSTAEAVATAIAGGTLVLAGSNTASAAVIGIADLDALTTYKVVAKDSTDYVADTITTFKIKDLVANDTAFNLVTGAVSPISYASQSVSIPLETGKYVTLLVVQTTDPVTASTLQTWLDSDAAAAYQVVANTTSPLPVVAGLSPVIKIQTNVKYNI